MIEFKQWSFSVERRNRFARKTMIGKTFDEYPTKPEEALEVDGIVFSVNRDEIKDVKQLPNFLAMVPNLKSVILPIDWLSKINIPEKIEELSLREPVYSDDNQKWPDNLKFDNLKHLSIPALYFPYEINLEEFTSLESIEYNFEKEKNNKVLLAIGKLPNIKKVVINYGRKFDLFTPFENSNIEYLRLWSCPNKKISFENIIKLPKLKILEINYITVELDCNLLLELKYLEVLKLDNVNKIINIEALLKHEKIKHLSICDCKKPFSKTNKELFLNHGFESLDIDYA